MGSGVNFNAASNYSIQQQYQQQYQYQQAGFGALDQTLSTGFNAAAGFAGPSFGPQIGQFASSFQNMNLNVFGQGMMNQGMGMGFGMGNIAPFGYTPNPMAELAYQNRYSGMQFSAAGGMAAFRGGVASQLQMGGQQFQTPGFFSSAAAQSLMGQQFGLPSEFQVMNRDFNQKLATEIPMLMAKGLPADAIQGYVRNLQMNHIEETLALASTMSQTSHNIAKSIIGKISA